MKLESSKPNTTRNFYPFTNGVIFRNVMRDPQYCKELISRVMGKPIREFTYNNTEQLVELNADGHHIRLDLIVRDTHGTFYDVEMEKHCKMPTLGRRSRYYASLLDAAYMHKSGRVFHYGTDVKDTYVIFICTFDPFQDGRHRYSFTMRCQENPQLELGDGLSIILLNAQGKREDCSPELKSFLDFVDGNTSQTDPFVVQLQQSVEALNQKPEVRRAAMDWETELNDVATQSHYEGLQEGLQQGMQQGLQQGLEKGREEQRNQMILKLNQRGVAAEVIAESADVTVDYVQKIVASQAQPVLPQ